MWKKIKTYGIAIAIPLLVGGLSALLSGNTSEMYQSYIQPALAPPSIVFPIVWTILFILMGISSGLIYRSGDMATRDALQIYGIQLAVNFFWPILFFALNLQLLAFFWLVLLIVLTAAMILQFSKISKPAAYLQIPYLLWLIFAAYLNLTIYFLNRS